MLTAGRPAPSAASEPLGFAAFYAEAEPAVRRFLRRRCPDRTLAEDLCQETLLTALRALREGREVNVAWAIGVARHKMREHHRRTSRERRRLERAGAAVPRAMPGVGLDAAAPVPGLDRLPDRQRQALLLRYAEDQAVAVVAARLGLTVRATESLLARARRTLRATDMPVAS